MNKKIKYLTFLVMAMFIGSLNVDAYVCKRADTLHTSGNTTYGRLGSGDTLTVGDAFDCDVNLDGTFDSTNERFYYIGPKFDLGIRGFFDDRTAVLVYSNNTVSAASYNEGSTAWTEGPNAAINYLPGNDTWVDLLESDSRSITDEKDNAKIDDFSYYRLSSRLLTYQEIANSCGNDITTTSSLETNCNFLLENAESVGYWLETLSAEANTKVWYVDSSERKVALSDVRQVQKGVRPTIEVPITDIASDDAMLHDIKMYNNADSGVILPTHTSTPNEYFATIDDSVETIKIVLEVEEHATYTINGGTSNLVNISDGLNIITVKVTSEDGRNTEIYTIKVNRLPRVDCSFPVKSVFLKVGQTANYSELYENGTRFAITDSSIASIKNGVITANRVGTTNIKIIYGDCPVKTTTITVVKADTIIEKTKALEIAINDISDLKEYVKDYNIKNWNVSDNNILKLENGKVTTLKVGSAIVTASGDNITYTFKIKVLNKITTDTGNDDVSMLTDDTNDKLESSKLGEETEQYKTAKQSITDAIKIEVHDLKITSDGSKTVVFNIPEGMKKENIAIYFLDGDKYVRVDAEIVNGKIQVPNARTGVYVIAEFNNETGIAYDNAKTTVVKDIENPKTGNKLPVVLALVGYLTIVGIVIYLKKKNKLSRI